MIGVQAYFSFMALSPERKKKFLELYCPPYGWMAEMMVSSMDENSETALQTRVSHIFACNSHATKDGGRSVSEIACRINHSCYPNCHMNHEGRGSSAVIIRPVMAGEEIVKEYHRNYRHRSIAERRFYFQSAHHFTCHCPRCDAPADEMRQFSCCNPKCKGRHFAVQPLSDKTYQGSKLEYTGVEYVAPHLLPCTNCKRAAPLAYQQKMFAIEEYANKVHAQLLEVSDPAPPYALTISIELRDLCTDALQTDSLERIEGFDSPSSMVAAYARENLQVTGSMVFNFPCEPTVRALHSAAHAHMSFTHASDIVQARELALQGIRMHKLIFGRNLCGLHDGCELEAVVRSVSTAPGVRGREERCAYCEESPAKVALKLSLCGRCRKVAYCSQQCQKAHWKVHKQQCKDS